MTESRAHRVFTAGETTIFEVMSGLAREHQAVNLGQGAPDHGEPREVLEAAAHATLNLDNQYPSMMGIPSLREAVAAHAKRFYGLSIDPAREVMVTCGATEALATAFLTFLQDGDEAIAFEPMYDSYAPMIRRAGGTVRPIRLEAPDWRFDPAELEAAFTDRTRVLVLNNPMNPIGKLFTRKELEIIAELCVAHDIIAIADEVYEHMAFDGHAFEPLIAMPGMRERTVRIASAGKTFSLTGWKIGLVTAHPDVMGPLAKCHQFVVFTIPPNLQHGIAHGLGMDDDYFTGLSTRMQGKRDRLTAGLRGAGFEVLPSAGTYFLIAKPGELMQGMDDAEFCKHITREAGVAAIPVSAFYEDAPPRDLVRFSFCKKDDVLDEGIHRLAAYFGG